ncbi:hypothetical protein N2152v2_000962 [Parachlorella kessleri]
MKLFQALCCLLQLVVAQAANGTFGGGEGPSTPSARVLPLIGTFVDPIIIPEVPFTTDAQSLSQGHLLLSQAVASLCGGYRASQFAAQEKLVFAYNEQGSGRPTTFILCNSGDFVQNYWLMWCPRQLSDASGDDASTAGCTCKLADEGRPPCPLGRYGFDGTVTTSPDYWYYVIIQANPPNTGEDPSETFTIQARSAGSGGQPAPAGQQLLTGLQTAMEGLVRNLGS